MTVVFLQAVNSVGFVFLEVSVTELVVFYHHLFPLSLRPGRKLTQRRHDLRKHKGTYLIVHQSSTGFKLVFNNLVGLTAAVLIHKILHAIISHFNYITKTNALKTTVILMNVDKDNIFLKTDGGRRRRGRDKTKVHGLVALPGGAQLAAAGGVGR